MGISSSERRRCKPSILKQQAVVFIAKAKAKEQQQQKVASGGENRVKNLKYKIHTGQDRQALYKKAAETCDYALKLATVRPNFPPDLLAEFNTLSESVRAKAKECADFTASLRAQVPLGRIKEHEKWEDWRRERFWPRMNKEGQKEDQKYMDSIRQMHYNWNPSYALGDDEPLAVTYDAEDRAEVREMTESQLKDCGSQFSDADLKRYKYQAAHHPITLTQFAVARAIDINESWSATGDYTQELGSELSRVLEVANLAVRLHVGRKSLMGPYDDAKFELLEESAINTAKILIEKTIDLQKVLNRGVLTDIWDKLCTYPTEQMLNDWDNQQQ